MRTYSRNKYPRINTIPRKINIKFLKSKPEKMIFILVSSTFISCLIELFGLFTGVVSLVSQGKNLRKKMKSLRAFIKFFIIIILDNLLEYCAANKFYLHEYFLMRFIFQFNYLFRNFVSFFRFGMIEGRLVVLECWFMECADFFWCDLVGDYFYYGWVFWRVNLHVFSKLIPQRICLIWQETKKFSKSWVRIPGNLRL